MIDLEEGCPRLKLQPVQTDLISILDKLPRYNCKWRPKEESLKMVVDWMAEIDFPVPKFQVWAILNAFLFSVYG